MRILSELVRKIGFAVASIAPKQNAVVLRGFPAYEDNLVSIYDALIARGARRIIWVVDDPAAQPPILIHENTRVVKYRSFADVYYSITARYLFITHGHFFRSAPHNQVTINLWHGIPLKAIGRFIEGEPGRSDTILSATSQFTRKIFSEAFDMPESKVAITGQPRTDIMLTADRGQIWKRIFPDIPLPRKIFIWLPTYRDAPAFRSNVDGIQFGNIYNCSDFSDSEFNSTLRDGDAFCIMKPHPMAPRRGAQNLSNLRFIDEKWMHDRGVTLYSLLGMADCLISDISSVILDYTLLDRPIILIFEDVESYGGSRGFSVNPVDKFLPASINKKFDEFLNEVSLVLRGDDIYSGRRREVRNLFFDYSDAGSARRVLDLILGD